MFVDEILKDTSSSQGLFEKVAPTADLTSQAHQNNIRLFDYCMPLFSADQTESFQRRNSKNRENMRRAMATLQRYGLIE